MIKLRYVEKVYKYTTEHHDVEYLHEVRQQPVLQYLSNGVWYDVPIVEVENDKAI